MEVTAAVLYDGALAHYDVKIENEGICRARLAEFKGSPQNAPPHILTLKKEGRHWVSDEAGEALSDDLGYAVELKVPRQVLMSVERRRDGYHPAA